MPSPPEHYGVVLYPGFQLLDVAGPLDILNLLSASQNLRISILADTLEPVSTLKPGATTTFGQSIVPTHTFATAPDDIDVLLVPGGIGAREDSNIKGSIEYIRNVFPKLQYLVTVCTGSAVAAKAGVLDGRRATSNKASFTWVQSTRSEVNWEKKARWVVDGNVWTSSGISAGIDVMYAFVGEMYGQDVAQKIADRSEYMRNKDATFDPFADMY